MNKIVLFLIAIVSLNSCSDEVKFNSPALQGNKNYELWRASYFEAIGAENGRLTIKAGDNIEKITFLLSSLKEGTYALSDVSFSKVDFIDFENISYSTSNTPDREGNLYPEVGEVVISKIEGNTITGSFRFMAFTADGLNSVGFNEGVFYKVPVR